MTVLIPIFGIFILFSSSANEYIEMSAEILGLTKEDALYVSRRNAFFMYFGLVLFSICTIMFNLLCPSIIKEFSDEFNYYESELKFINKSRADILQKKLKDNYGLLEEFNFELGAVEGAASRASNFMDNISSDNRDYWLKSKSDSVFSLLRKHYDSSNSAGINKRRFIVTGYVISFIMISIPSLITLVKVVSVI